MNGFVAGLLAGLLLGAGLGFLLFSGGSPPSGGGEEVHPPTPSSDRPVRLEGPALAAAPPSAESAAGVEPAPVEFLRTANAQRLWEWLNEGKGRTPTREEILLLVPRLRETFGTGDAELFHAFVEAIGRSKDPEALAALVRVLADESVEMPSGSGARFRRALGEASAPGIAAAARMRFERMLAAGETSWVAADGWLALAAVHGDAEDVAWVARQAQSGQIRRMAWKAIAESSHPEAVRLFEERILTSGGWDEFPNFAKANPAAATALARRVFEATLAGRTPPPNAGLREVLATWARHVPPDEVESFKRRLASLADGDRIQAVYAAQVLAQRRLDLSGLEAVLAAPAAVLREWSRSGRPQDDFGRAQAAAYAIESNRVAWSEDSALALEAAAGGATTGQFAETARQVRAGLASPWRD